jgi:hypothetical protein
MGSTSGGSRFKPVFYFPAAFKFKAGLNFEPSEV